MGAGREQLAPRGAQGTVRQGGQWQQPGRVRAAGSQPAHLDPPEVGQILPDRLEAWGSPTPGHPPRFT